MNLHHWTPAELATLRARYPHERTDVLAHDLGVSVHKVYGMAASLGLHKSAAFLASGRSGRIQRGRTDPRMTATQFKTGFTPWNKGLKHPKDWAPGRMGETQFKKGRPACEARNYRPIGSYRVTRDGALERKVTDDPSICPARRWVRVTRLVWEAAHGPIPPRHVVRFRPGMATIQRDEITLDRLECISMRENMHRNSLHRLPKPLANLIQLRGALTRVRHNVEREHQVQP